MFARLCLFVCVWASHLMGLISVEDLQQSSQRDSSFLLDEDKPGCWLAVRGREAGNIHKKLLTLNLNFPIGLIKAKSNKILLNLIWLICLSSLYVCLLLTEEAQGECSNRLHTLTAHEEEEQLELPAWIKTIDFYKMSSN